MPVGLVGFIGPSDSTGSAGSTGADSGVATGSSFGAQAAKNVDKTIVNTNKMIIPFFFIS